jgi:solute carrier family 25 (mitochondrial iron transporter), member 28/37
MAEGEEDWEEWDGVSPFWHHCVAGSAAGLVEHTLVYPLDTVRTHIQVCANCKFSPAYQQAMMKSSSAANNSAFHHATNSMRGRMTTSTRMSAVGTTSHHPALLPQGMWQTMRYLMSEPSVVVDPAMTAVSAAAATTTEPPKAEGVRRLWRGVQTVMIGCIPAHAIYFSTYEMVKASFQSLSPSNELVWYGGMMAGAMATLGHDIIMTPLDTCKQRLQLGHYQGSMSYALQQMVHKEGMVSLYRSFPVTLFANVPYGMIMVTTNESLKQLWTTTRHHGDGGGPTSTKLTLGTTLMASSVAGFVASAATTPLDRIKTLLQTQHMAPACWPTPPVHCPQKKIVSTTDGTRVIQTAYEALTQILKQEGTIGLFRGIVPRVMSHTPAVAISWTTYETAKSVLWKVTS